MKPCPLSKKNEFFRVFKSKTKGSCLYIDIFTKKMKEADIHIKYDKQFYEKVKGLEKVYNSDEFLILISGKRGSGKTVFSKIAKIKGIKTIEMSNIVFRKMIEKGYKINNENTILFSKMIRNKYGKDIVAKWVYSTIKDTKKICISGIRSIEEVKFFKLKKPSLLIFIKADDNVRIKRIFSRKRDTDPNTITQYIQREIVENKELGLNKVQNIVDIYLTNNEEIGSFMKKSDKLIRFLLRDSS